MWYQEQSNKLKGKKHVTENNHCPIFLVFFFFFLPRGSLTEISPKLHPAYGKEVNIKSYF